MDHPTWKATTYLLKYTSPRNSQILPSAAFARISESGFNSKTWDCIFKSNEASLHFKESRKTDFAQIID
jgi:hypothetical protein